MISFFHKRFTKLFVIPSTIFFVVAILLFTETIEVRADHTLDTSQQNNSLTANPATFTYTSGSGSTVIVLNLVVIGATARTGGAPTYNGVTMTQADSTRIATETNVEMWYLLNPPTGSAYTVSIPNTNTRTIHAFTVTAKAQAGYTSALDTANGATGTTANPSVAVTTTANGDFVTSIVGHGINTTTGITGNKTQYGGVWLIDHGNIASLRMYELQAVSGLTTHTFTVGAEDWGMVVAGFKQVPLVTTIADGGTPGSATVAPESGIVDLDYFTLATDIGTDTVTAITVSLSPTGTFNNIAQVDITDNSNVARCTAVTGLTSNTVTFSTCTSNGGIPVNTSATTYKVRITPKTHEFMPSPATGASYATNGTVTAFTSTNASHVLTDTSSATLTIDNLSPGASTGASATPGDTQITVSWTNPVDADFSNLVVLRDTATIGSGSVPAEGSSPTVGSSCGGTACQVRYISSGTSFIDTSLSNGATYYYRIFAKDTRGNYTAFGSTQQVSAVPTAAPDTTPPTPNPMTFATAPANDSTTQISMTSTVGSDASSPVNYLFTNDNSTCGANAGTGGTTSSWQVSTSYSDSGLSPNKCYGYTVTARDSLSNTGTASGISSTYTSANTPGTPFLGGGTATTLNLTNAENSNPASNPTTNFAVQVVTTSPSDATWLTKWVNASGAPSDTAVWLTDAQLDALVLQGLQSSTLYGVKVKARNQDTDETPLSVEGQGTTSSTPTTTLGTGTDPVADTVAPGTSIRDAGAFTFVTSTGGDTVTGLTVTLAGSGTPYAGLGEMRITSDNGLTTYFTAVTSFSSNSVSFSGGTSIPVSSGAPVQFKIRLTPMSHPSMPAPAGANYDFTVYVSSFTSTNAKVTSDSNANTLTIDNLSPGASTGASATPGDTQITVSWTNPVDADFSNLVVLRDTATIGSGSVPAEGSSPTVGSSCGGTACQVRYISSGTSFIDTSLSNGATYYYRIFAKDTRGNYTAYASTQQVSAMPTSSAVTTIADGSNPGNATIAPGAGVTNLNAFTFVTNISTDTVTAVTVSLSPAGAFNNIAQVDITDDSNLIRCTSVVNPGSNVIAFSPCTSNGGIPVTTSATTYKVRITPKTHSQMPAVPGVSYATTGTITAFTSTNTQGGSDSASAIITVDNASPADVSNEGGTAGNAQVTISWTNPADADYHSALVLRRAGSAVTDTPVEGDTYTDGSTLGSSYVVCVASTPTATCSDTGLTNGTAYHYKIFSKDSNGNYAAGVVPSGSPFTPSLTTFTITSSSGANGTIVPLGATSVAQGSSQLYSAIPDTGYEVAVLTVDGTPVVPVPTSYTFTDVQETHTISASFTVAPEVAPTIVANTGASRPTTIIFLGKAFPGGKVSILNKELRSEELTGKEITPDADGSFRISFVGILQGLQSFGLIAKDKDQRVSQTKFFFVDTRSDSFVEKDILVPPTIDITNGQVSRGGTATIFGYASLNHSIHLYIDGILTKESLVEKDGSYRFDIPTGALDFGQHKAKTKQTNVSKKQESDFSTEKTFIVSKLVAVKADLSGDGKIDIKDWSIFLARWGSKTSLGRAGIDLNSDGKVDIADFSIFIKTIRKK